MRQAHHVHSSRQDLQGNMSSLLNSLMFLFTDPARLRKLPEFKSSIVQHNLDLVETLINLKALAVNPTEGFLPVGKTNCKRICDNSRLSLKNKYALLADKI